MNIRTTLRIAPLGLTLLLAACRLEAAQGGAEDHAAQAGVEDQTARASASEHAAHTAEASGALTGEGPWTMTASDGSHVTLALTGELAPGPVSLTVGVHSTDAEVRGHSVDLVSPAMPMHGIVRYPVKDGDVEISLPMEGRWAIYVNLDDAGQVNAEFLFDVIAGDAGGHIHPGGG